MIDAATVHPVAALALLSLIAATPSPQPSASPIPGIAESQRTQTDPQTATPSEAPRTEYVGSTTQDPVANRNEAKPGPTREAGNKNDEHTWRDWWWRLQYIQVGIGGVALALTFVSLVMLGFSLRATRHAANAARDSADAAKISAEATQSQADTLRQSLDAAKVAADAASESAKASARQADVAEKTFALADRPLVILTGFVDTAHPPPGVVKIGGLKLKNIGKGPAWLDAGEVRFYPEYTTVVLDKPNYTGGVNPLVVGDVILPPGESYDLLPIDFEHPHGLTVDIKGQTQTGTAILAFYGFVQYRDIAQREHRTGFAWTYGNKWGTVGWYPLISEAFWYHT